jgi:hypothetical protein
LTAKLNVLGLDQFARVVPSMAKRIVIPGETLASIRNIEGLFFGH